MYQQGTSSRALPDARCHLGRSRDPFASRRQQARIARPQSPPAFAGVTLCGGAMGSCRRNWVSTLRCQVDRVADEEQVPCPVPRLCTDPVCAFPTGDHRRNDVLELGMGHRGRANRGATHCRRSDRVQPLRAQPMGFQTPVLMKQPRPAEHRARAGGDRHADARSSHSAGMGAAAHVGSTATKHVLEQVHQPGGNGAGRDSSAGARHVALAAARAPAPSRIRSSRRSRSWASAACAISVRNRTVSGERPSPVRSQRRPGPVAHAPCA